MGPAKPAAGAAWRRVEVAAEPGGRRQRLVVAPHPAREHALGRDLEATMEPLGRLRQLVQRPVVEVDQVDVGEGIDRCLQRFDHWRHAPMIADICTVVNTMKDRVPPWPTSQWEAWCVAEDAARHRLAASFDQAAELYPRARPEYPAALYERLLAGTGLASPARLLEVGAATGKATLPLARRGSTSPASSRDRHWRRWRGPSWPASTWTSSRRGSRTGSRAKRGSTSCTRRRRGTGSTPACGTGGPPRRCGQPGTSPCGTRCTSSRMAATRSSMTCRSCTTRLTPVGRTTSGAAATGAAGHRRGHRGVRT